MTVRKLETNLKGVNMMSKRKQRKSGRSSFWGDAGDFLMLALEGIGFVFKIIFKIFD